MKSLILLFFFAASLPVLAFEREEYEEPAGSSFSVLLNPEDGIYGIAFGDGTWIKNAPVYGGFCARILYSDLEESWYTGASLTVRLMPRWFLAPFAGVGGSYNYSLSQGSSDDRFDDEELPDRGESYWGGHVETGIRFKRKKTGQMFEVMGRYTMSSLDGEHDYWLAGISTGIAL